MNMGEKRCETCDHWYRDRYITTSGHVVPRSPQRSERKSPLGHGPTKGKSVPSGKNLLTVGRSTVAAWGKSGR